MATSRRCPISVSQFSQFSSVSSVGLGRPPGGRKKPQISYEILWNPKTHYGLSPNLLSRALEPPGSLLGASSTRGHDPRPILPNKKVSHFSQSVQFSSVSSVQFSWFGEPSRGTPKSQISYEILKVKSCGPQTWPFPPIKRALSRTDAADYEVAHLSPLIRNISPSVGTSEFGHFQKTHE